HFGVIGTVDLDIPCARHLRLHTGTAGFERDRTCLLDYAKRGGASVRSDPLPGSDPGLGFVRTEVHRSTCAFVLLDPGVEGYQLNARSVRIAHRTAQGIRGCHRRRDAIDS